MRLAVAFCLIALPAHAQDKTIDYQNDDSAMNAAIAEANETFDAFWQRVVGEDGLADAGASIKVAVPYGGDNREHIWMGPCKELDPPQFVCIVANAPVHVNPKLGDPYLFLRSDVSDWMIRREDGIIEGAYTLRVMLPDLPEEQAEGFRKVLAPLPE